MPRTLAQNAQYIAETIKPAIKSAIEAQGVTVPSTDSFLDYADRIAEIEGGGSGYQLKDLPTGSISTVNDAAELPLNALKVSVEAWQEGSGDPSPSNIRPIHGRSQATITDISNYYVGSPSFDGYSNLSLWTKLDETYRGHEVYKRTSAWNGIYKAITLPVGVYTFSSSVKTSDGANVNVYFVRNDSTATTNIDEAEVATTTNWARISATFEVLQEGTVAVRIERSTVGDIYISEYQIERGNTAHDYCSYQLKTTTFNFPTTIYGAEWDVADGELGLKITDDGINLNTLSFQKHGTGNNNIYYASMPTTCALPPDNNTALADFICSDYPTQSWEYLFFPNRIGIAVSNTGLVAVANPNIATVEDFASSITNTTIRYPLAHPQIITQTGLSIRLLEGTNNLYADCGEVIEGEYFVGETKAYDLVEYIESDGTQVIDTGRQVVQGQTIEVTFEGSSNQTAYAWIFGGITSSDYYGYQFPNSSTVYSYNGGTSASSQSGFSSNVLTQKALTFNGSANANIHILGLLDGSAYSNQGKFKVYFLDIDGDYFVPAKRRSDGVYGLYDIANSQFLTDVASGNPLTGGASLGIRIG